jgi:hypothetical protein
LSNFVQPSSAPSARATQMKNESDVAEQRMRGLLRGNPEKVASRSPTWQVMRYIFSSKRGTAFVFLPGVVRQYANLLPVQEVNLLGLVAGGNKSSTVVLIEAIGRMSIRDKWHTVGRLKHFQRFDFIAPAVPGLSNSLQVPRRSAA